jgi:uncharacterized protein involved in exopolysaccharide biosynthesis
MEFVSYLFRFLYRIKWWLILGPIAVALIVIYKTQDLARTYNVKTTIYTGAVSGFSVEPDGTIQNMSIINNTMDNLISIIKARSTLRVVSMRLFAQHMMHGDANKDNNYILARNYQHLLNITPKAVQGLIDKTSEEKTLKKLFDYADADTKNFLYGLFNWAPPYYSYDALSKISVKRLGNSDMIEIEYSTDDPGIAFHTLDLLNEEFIKQYEGLRFGESDKIIHFFEQELAKTKAQLNESEDSLTEYNIEKRIINYDEQTSHLAALSRDFELQYEEIFLNYNSSMTLVQELEKRIGENAQLLRNNSLFIHKLNQIAELSSQIARIETFGTDSATVAHNNLDLYKKQLKKKEDEFKTFSDSLHLHKYTKEGYLSTDLIEQWLSEVLKLREAEAKLKVMEQWQTNLDKRYVYYSPVGSTIKRKEREINFTESSYLELLHSLNVARLRQKSLQMTSATLRVLNPPTFPLASEPTKRKMKIITAFLGSFIFILGYFMIIELLDQTLRDKIRTERITSGKVIGAFPRKNQLRHRGYSKTVNNIAAKCLGTALFRFFSPGKIPVINLISTENGDGKTFLAQQLASYYTSVGFTPKIISWHTDFSYMSKEFLLARNIDDLSVSESEDLFIVEYPPLKESSVPKDLLQQANINLLAIRATRTWKDADKILFKNLTDQVQSTPVCIVLNETKREVTEYFTGLLPPYTFIRKFFYRIFQLGLTASEKVE